MLANLLMPLKANYGDTLKLLHVALRAVTKVPSQQAYVVLFKLAFDRSASLDDVGGSHGRVAGLDVPIITKLLRIACLRTPYSHSRLARQSRVGPSVSTRANQMHLQSDSRLLAAGQTA